MQITRWLTSLFIITVVIVSLGFVKFSQIQAAIAYGESFPEPSASVHSEYVQTIEHAKRTKVVGELVAPQMLTLSTEFAGPITFVGFQPGDVVEKGQLLLRQDTRLEQANLDAANARLSLAKLNHKRLSALLQQQRASQSEVDAAKADVDIAKAEVDNLASVIDKMNVVAPFNGRVGLEQFQVGQMLDANAQITSLIGLDSVIWVDFAIPQTLEQPNVGDEVVIEAMQAGSTPLTARIIAKQPMLDAGSRQQSYRAQLDNSAGLLSHNQMVSVFVYSKAIEQVAVPTNAITRNHFGYFVYKLQKDDNDNWRAAPLQVTVGERVNDKQIVLSGLNPGEYIATEGAFKLYENILVYPQAPELQASAEVGGQQ